MSAPRMGGERAWGTRQGDSTGSTAWGARQGAWGTRQGDSTGGLDREHGLGTKRTCVPWQGGYRAGCTERPKRGGGEAKGEDIFLRWPKRGRGEGGGYFFIIFLYMQGKRWYSRYMAITPLRNIRVNTETWEAARAAALARGTNASAVVVACLAAYARDPELMDPALRDPELLFAALRAASLMRDSGFVLSPPRLLRNG
jgi:hypothetical protein